MGEHKREGDGSGYLVPKPQQSTKEDRNGGHGITSLIDTQEL